MRTMCSNSECRWSREAKGGKFIWHGRAPFCEDCANPRYVMNDGENRWNFMTTNLHPEGKPVHVQSLRHLRQLEQQYGAVSAAANMEHRNWRQ